MGIEAFIGKLLGRQRDEQAAAMTTWFVIVRQLADGRDPDAAKTAALLKELGKSADDLKTAVALHLRRRQLKAAVDAVPGLEAEKAEILRKREIEAEELHKAHEKYDRIVAPMEARLQWIESVTNRAINYSREELVRDCPYAEAAARVKSLRKQAMDLIDERDALRRRKTELYDLAGQNEVLAQNSKIEGEKVACQQEARSLRERASQARTDAEERDLQAKEVERKAVEAEAAMLEV